MDSSKPDFESMTTSFQTALREWGKSQNLPVLNQTQQMDLILVQLASTQQSMTSIQQNMTSMREDVQEFKSAIQTEVQEFKSAIQTEVQEFKTEIRHEFKELGTEVKQLRTEMRQGFVTVNKRIDVVYVLPVHFSSSFHHILI